MIQGCGSIALEGIPKGNPPTRHDAKHLAGLYKCEHAWSLVQIHAYSVNLSTCEHARQNGI